MSLSDLNAKVIGLFVLLVTSLVSIFVPLCFYRWFVRPKGQIALQLLSSGVGGMILGTVLLHLMPDMEEFLRGYEEDKNLHIDYPVLEVTIVFAFTLTMALDKGIASRYSQKRRLGPDADVKFRLGELEAKANDPVSEKTTESATKQTAIDSVEIQTNGLKSGDEDLEAGALNRYPGFQEYTFAFGISVHAMIEGMGVGFMDDASSTLFTPLVELILHKIMLAVSLVVQLFRGRVNWKATAVIGVIYSMVTPIAIAIGIGITENGSSETPSGMLSEGIFQAVGSGVLIYVITVVILLTEFSTRDRNTEKFFFFLVGFLMVAIISFVPHDHGGSEGDHGHSHGHGNVHLCNATATSSG